MLPVASDDVNVLIVAGPLLDPLGRDVLERQRIADCAQNLVLLEADSFHIVLVLLQEELFFLSQVGVLGTLLDLIDVFMEVLLVEICYHLSLAEILDKLIAIASLTVY